MISLLFPSKLLSEIPLYDTISAPQTFMVYITSTTYMFTLLIMFITYHIMNFSKFYMDKLQFTKIFMLIMMGFASSMFLLLISNSLMMLFISWELLGITSWVLILFYFSWSSFQGSFLTMFINRMGDSFLLISVLIFPNKISWGFVVFMMFMMITKSSQFPFISWLPAAMAAPTPVSALVHSSTLVTAGLILMFRFNLMMSNSFLTKLMGTLGLITMMMGAWMAYISSDFKKLIAYSTLSQLGLMMSFMTTLWYSVMMFHLMSHAIIKSFLFMVCGFVMASMNSQNVLKSAGNLSKMITMNLTLMVIMNFMNVSFMMMWFSKEINVLAYSYLTFYSMILILSYFGLTMLYSIRIFMLLAYIKMKAPTIILDKSKFNLTNYCVFIFMMLFSLMYLSHIINFTFISINYKMLLVGMIFILVGFSHLKWNLWHLVVSGNFFFSMLWKEISQMKEELVNLKFLYSLNQFYKMMSNKFWFFILLYIFMM